MISRLKVEMLMVSKHVKKAVKTKKCLDGVYSSLPNKRTVPYKRT